MKSLSSKQGLSHSATSLSGSLVRLTLHLNYVNSLYQAYKEAANRQIGAHPETSTLKSFLYVLLHVTVFINYRRAIRHSSFIDYSRQEGEMIVPSISESSKTEVCSLSELSKELRDKRIKETFRNMQEALSA